MSILKKKVVLGIALVVILFGGVCVAKLNSHKSNSVVEQGTVSYNSKFKSNAPGNIVFPAYTQDMEIKKNSGSLPIMLVNPKVNKTVYLQYTVSVMDKGGKDIQVGKTKLIQSGQALSKLPLLSKNLEKLNSGIYKCRIDVCAYTYDNKTKTKTKLSKAHWDVQAKLS